MTEGGYFHTNTPMPQMRPKQWPSVMPTDERVSWLALVPVALTAGFYLLPAPARQNLFLQFLPQFAAYGVLFIWWKANTDALPALGLSRNSSTLGVKWGIGTGCILGVVNSTVILWVVPALGGDVLFLAGTPHARMPLFVMIPWFTVLIAIAVELNFRGFLLGRLEYFCCRWLPVTGAHGLRVGSIVAMVVSALVFAFDPFMVMTFRHLHWIAVWDGLIWAGLFLWWRNLATVIAAHAIEVMILYLSVKTALV